MSVAVTLTSGRSKAPLSRVTILDTNVEKKNTSASNISSFKNVNTKLITINESIAISFSNSTHKNNTAWIKIIKAIVPVNHANLPKINSYLLIGFWYKKESANNAAIKAFVTNRVGDFGLMIAIALIYLTFDSVEFSQVFAASKTVNLTQYNFFGYNLNTIDITCILLFIGAMGKSAQIGLHVWLADAMEGPTPVSALIHAATMVTAGVFLVARCSPLFEMSPIALGMVTIVGAATAIFAATIAITQNDIKKIIAYSTCSQLGYMFFACGVSAYSAAIFHLATVKFKAFQWEV